jgi:hypothetical protein
VEVAMKPQASKHLIIELELEPRSAARARAAMSSLRQDAHNSSFDDVILMVSELVADAIATYPRLSEATITVEADVLNGSTWVMTRFDGLRLRLSGEKPRPSDSGWGIHLVQTLATRWGAGRSADSTYVWFEA